MSNPWRLSWLVLSLPQAVLGQSAMPPGPPRYQAALETANSVYGSSSLTLSPDGRWLVIAFHDSVTVVRSAGGASLRVPLPASMSCLDEWDSQGNMWNAQGVILALVCRSPTTRMRTVFTWRRGASTVHVVDSASGLSWVRWLDDRRLAYAIVPSIERSNEAQPSAEPSGQRCVPAPEAERLSGDDASSAVALLCSDSVDIVRSQALKTTLETSSESKPTTVGKLSTPISVESASFQVIVADLKRGTRRVVARLGGSLADLLPEADGGRITIMVRDGSLESGREDLGPNTVYFVSTSGGSPTTHHVLREPDPARHRFRVLAPDGTALVSWPHFAVDKAIADTLYIIPVTHEAPPLAVALRRDVGQSDALTEVQPPDLAGYREPPLWTPDGKRVLVATEGRLWQVQRADGTAQLLIGDTDRAVARVVSVSNQDALTVMVDRPTGRMAFVSVRLNSGRWHLATEYPQSPASITVARQGARTAVAYVAATRASPYNVYFGRLTAPNGPLAVRRLTDVSVAAPLPAMRSTMLTYPVVPGVMGTAILLRSESATQPSPTIVSAYPGGQAASLRSHRLGLGINSDVFAAIARGYAFLYVDIPMTPEGVYGPRGPADAMVDGMSAALAAAAGTGLVDTTRLGVVGHSYGGTMVNVLVTRLPWRFSAAVSMSGMSDFASAVYGGTVHGPNWFQSHQGRMQVPFSEDPDRYLANSPVRYLERVTTPLLLLHGDRDPIVSVSQSEEMFRGLAQLGKPVELVRYHEGHHGPGDGWWQRALDWFDTFLQPAPR
jgi:predicted esterase